MPCQQTLSPSKGTDTHLILHWTDPGAKLALSGTRQALALVSKAHDRSSRKGRTETVLSCHIIPCLCQDRQLMLPTAQGKMDFSTQKAFKSLQGQYCLHRNQLYCTDIKVHVWELSWIPANAKNAELVQRDWKPVAVSRNTSTQLQVKSKRRFLGGIHGQFIHRQTARPLVSMHIPVLLPHQVLFQDLNFTFMARKKEGGI